MSEDLFNEADIVFRYTRRQAIRDGMLIDCTNTDFKYLLDRLGIKIHVAMTAGAWNATVGGIDEPIPAGQTIEGRLWDVLYAFRYAISRNGMETDRVHFKVSVGEGNTGRRTVSLWSLVGPGDSGEPVITIMLEGED